MIEVVSMSCCGIREIAGLSSYAYEDKKDGFDIVIRRLLTTDVISIYGSSYSEDQFGTGALLFTQATYRTDKGRKSGYGYRFAADIVKRKLGTVTEAKGYINPNTGYHITPFIWTFSKSALYRYAKWVDNGRPVKQASSKRGIR